MRRNGTAATLVAIALMAAPLAAPAQAGSPVEITRFDITPECVQPGGVLNARATVHNNTIAFQTFWTRVTIAYNGVVVRRTRPDGPYTIPSFWTATVTDTFQLPLQAPPGRYRITLGIGPSRTNAMGWDQASDTIRVALVCLPG